MHGFHGRYGRFDPTTGKGSGVMCERLQAMIRRYNPARGGSVRGEIPESAYPNLAVDAPPVAA